MLIFALTGSERLGDHVARAAGVALAPHEERDFGGGEHKARPLIDVRGREVFVLHGLQPHGAGSVNDRLVRLAFFAATCKSHGATRVTLVTPYLAYARKDRRTQPFDPLSTAHVARMIEALGTDRIVTFDVHNLAAFENAFRIETLPLTAKALLAEDVALRVGHETPVVASPDVGGLYRAQLLRDAVAQRLGRAVAFGICEKRRVGDKVSGMVMAGDVADRPVFFVDDMIVGGTTMRRAAQAARQAGASQVHVLATHALMDDAGLTALLYGQLIDSLTVTDSVAPFAVSDWPATPRVRVMALAGMIAEVLHALHDGRPLPRGVAVDGGQ